ncbi:MAG: hypothetical protein ACLQHT_13560 [Terracidiphilus sp.]
MSGLTFMQAIAREEGFGVNGTRATRNNNPGNLDMEPWLAGFGARLETPVNSTEQPRFAAFPSPDAGFAAMKELLAKDYVGLTISAALNKWAPPIENETNSYIENVCDWTGFTSYEVLTEAML